jgi:hypothetical protein
MKNNIKVIETYPPFEIGKTGLHFDALGGMYEYLTKGKIKCEKNSKIMIHSVLNNTTSEIIEINSINVLNIIIPTLINCGAYQISSAEDKFIQADNTILTALRYFERKYCSTDYLFTEASKKIHSAGFHLEIASRKVKIIDYTAQLMWRYNGILTYDIQFINTEKILFSKEIWKIKTRHIPPGNTGDLQIKHGINFIQIILKNSKNYWLIDSNLNIQIKNDLEDSGDGKEQFNLALFHLSDSNPYKNIDEGKFWLQKSFENGFQKAKKELIKLKEINDLN